MKTHHTFEHPNVSEALPSILAHVMMDGEEVGSRQGERTLEILMPRIALALPWQREVLVPGRKASIAAQIAETMWVLAGRNDVEWLSHYLPRAEDFSDDGTTWTGGYGPRIRKWDGWPHQNSEGKIGVDQLARVVDLLNNERGTRRAVINIYDPSVDSIGGKDVPCNNWLSFISRLGKLHMNVATRSNDVIWGWSGINQFEWSVLQEIVAYLTGNQVGTLTFNVTSLHVYEKHWEKARKIVDTFNMANTVVMQDSPRFNPEFRTVDHLDELIEEWFSIELAIRNGEMVSGRVDTFPEPMMQSWLRVIQWYWSGDMTFMEPLKGTRLYEAAKLSPKRKPTAAEQAVLNNPHVSQAIKETFEGTGEVAPLLPGTAVYDFLRAHEGDSIRLDDHTTAVVGPVQSPKPGKMNPFRAAAAFSTRDKVAPLAWTTQFVEYVDNLHREKSAVYGDSWKRRGEQMAILANIARKVDRLGEGGAGDTAADTVIDLLVYLVKYRLWLNEHLDGVSNSEVEDDAVRAVLGSEDRSCVKVVQHASIPPRIVAIKEFFEQLTILVQAHEIGNALQARIEMVDHMIRLAFPTARYFWGVENGHLLNPYQAAELFTTPLASVKEANATRRWAGYEAGENLD